MLNGIDISPNNSAPYPFDGVDIVGIKASEGKGWSRPDVQAAQIAAARAAGKRVHHYHYSWWSNDGGDDAANFLAQVAPHMQPGDVLVLDWERSPRETDAMVLDKVRADGITVPDNATADQVAVLIAARARAYRAEWLPVVRAAHPDRRILLYCNRNTYTTVDRDSAAGFDGLWLARYGVQPGDVGIQDPWIGHQYTETGGPNGGPLDRSVWQFDGLAAYDQWAGVPAEAPAGQTIEARVSRLEGAVEHILTVIGAPLPAPEPRPEPAPQPEPAPAPQPADDGQDRHTPDGYPYTNCLTLQRLIRAASTDVLTGEDYNHRHQAIVSLRAVMRWTDDVVPPQGRPWSAHFRMFWSGWQKMLGYTGAAADGVPGETSVWELAQRVGLAYWDADRQASTPATTSVPAASAASDGRVPSPVPGHGVTTPYGKRKAGLWTGKGYHTGDDYACAVGTPAVAVLDGTVSVMDDDVLGCIAVLSATNGRHYWYCHLTRGSRVTGPVKAGQQIATTNETGTGALGPHLHFEDKASRTSWSASDRKPQW